MYILVYTMSKYGILISINLDVIWHIKSYQVSRQTRQGTFKKSEA
uniref:Uncharacterized protein n=1 Tax=Weissella hellenica TaxID=46256 RepID=H1A8I7_WEIHE|nr:hypothetical protein [Weissella hellenica]